MWVEETLIQPEGELDVMICPNCHIAVRKSFLINDMPYMNYCPNCGEKNNESVDDLKKKLASCKHEITSDLRTRLIMNQIGRW